MALIASYVIWPSDLPSQNSVGLKNFNLIPRPLCYKVWRSAFFQDFQSPCKVSPLLKFLFEISSSAKGSPTFYIEVCPPAKVSFFLFRTKQQWKNTVVYWSNAFLLEPWPYIRHKTFNPFPEAIRHFKMTSKNDYDKIKGSKIKIIIIIGRSC